MAVTQYFGSKPVLDWNPNGSAESGHNFIEQINEQKGKIAEHEGRYQDEYGKIAGARSAYEDAYKNQQNYSDIYKQAKADEGVEDARSQYQKSLASVNATQTAMNNLPSSVNAGSNVVLNASQRNAALGNQMGRYQNTLDAWTRQNADDLSGYQTALASAQDTAGKVMGQEQAKVSQSLQTLQNQMDMANKLYDQVIQERQVMRSIYGDMYEDEYKHMQHELEVWAANLQAETDRYKEAQANYRAQLSADAQKYASDAMLRLQKLQGQQAGLKNWNFGNGYALQALPNGEASYTKDGRTISAAEFINGTNAGGAKWDTWNDVWNNGVSTRGVGSDTIQGMYNLANSKVNLSSPFSSVNNMLKTAGKYTYLR